MDKAQDIMQTIEEYLKTKFPEREDLSVGGIESISGGASYGIFMFTAYWKEAQKPVSENFVIRREPDVGLVPPYDIRPEYEVMKRIHGAGVPVPKVYFLEEDSRILGRPFILMEMVEGGERLFDAWLKQPEHRAQLMKDYVSMLARIHGVDWQALGLSLLGEPENDRHYAEKQIARWEKVAEENQYTPYPIMTELFTWLKRNIPRAERTALCHGDYSVFNAHARNGQVVSILDWEMVGIGDPISDLGWACHFTESMGVPDWDETAFIRSYEEITGEKVNEESFFFWKVYAYTKMAAISIAAIRVGIKSEEINMLLVSAFSSGLPGLQDKAARMLGF